MSSGGRTLCSSIIEGNRGLRAMNREKANNKSYLDKIRTKAHSIQGTDLLKFYRNISIKEYNRSYT